MKKLLSIVVIIPLCLALNSSTSFAQEVKAVVKIQDPLKIDTKEVSKYINKIVKTTGKIVSTRLIESNNMTLLNVGGENPNQDFTIMIKSDNRSKFGQPEIDLKGKTVTVEGMVIDYRGKPEIEVTDLKQIKVIQ